MIVTLFGSSGLVGKYCLNLLEKEPSITKVILPVRKQKSEIKANPKLEYVETDFLNLSQYGKLFATDAVICCLGTTLKKAGNKKGREFVDLKLPLAIAGLAKSKKVRHFLLISAQGANASSWIHYNRTKGLVEQGLEMFDFSSLTIVRPSLLLGDRTEKRRGEEILKKLLEGRLQFIPEFWRPIHAETVARALVQSLLDPPKGKRMIYNRKLVRAEAALWASENAKISK